MLTLTPTGLTAHNFKAYGNVIELSGHNATTINDGNCLRYSDLATLDICNSGVTGISLFDAKPYSNPVLVKHVERHPLGSQAFLPASAVPYLVVVASDEEGVPGQPSVFITDGRQGVNYYRNTWHGVLTPIRQKSLFFVVDYIGSGNNLQEYEYPSPYSIDYGQQ